MEMGPIIRSELGASLVAQLVNKLPTMQETTVQFLGEEDPLELVMDREA